MLNSSFHSCIDSICIIKHVKDTIINLTVHLLFKNLMNKKSSFLILASDVFTRNNYIFFIISS